MLFKSVDILFQLFFIQGTADKCINTNNFFMLSLHYKAVI